MNCNPQAPSDCYKSIASPSTGIYKDKGSKFLAFAYPVESEEEVKSLVSALRKKYFDARHHCWAYRIGRLGEKWRINDDGEPSSTAGKPILGQILSNQLSDILIVVVRYFGGILLGTPGLIQAYKSAAADAIANGSIIEKIACEPYRIEFDYIQMNSVMKLLKDMQITPRKQVFDNRCAIEADVRLDSAQRLCESLKTIAICQKV